MVKRRRPLWHYVAAGFALLVLLGIIGSLSQPPAQTPAKPQTQASTSNSNSDSSNGGSRPTTSAKQAPATPATTVPNGISQAPPATMDPLRSAATQE